MEATNQKQQSSHNSDQVVQKEIEDPLGISQEDIQKALQVKCKKHPKRNAEYLYLTSDVSNARICTMCIKEGSLLLKNCQDIREIFWEWSEKEYLCYPVLTDSEIGELIQTISNNIDSETNLLDNYFQELTNMIEVILRRRKEAQKLKLIQYGDIYQRSQLCWSEIIDIENLRKILLDENNEEKLAQFVRNHVSNAEKNTQRIKEIYDQFKGLKEEFSLKQPTDIRSLVSSLLEEIHFFMGPRPSILHAIEQNEQYQNELQRKQQELQNCQSQIHQAQQTIQDQQLLLEEIQNLKERYSLEIDSIKQQNSDLKKSISEKDQEISVLKQENQTIKNDNSVLKKSISDKDQEISGLKQENQTIMNDNPGLNQQLKDKESNTNLKEQLDFEKQSSEPMNQQPIQKEFLSLKPTDMLPGTNLILGNYDNSKYLSVSKNKQQHLEFFHASQSDYCGLSYLDFILNPSTNYVVHVELQQTKGQNKYFFFGLLSDADKETTDLPKRRLRYSEQKENGGDLNTYLKGTAIRTNANSLDRKSLEMRINIERQILRVGSLPNYESVVQIDDPNKIESATPYRFYLSGLNENTKITITKFESVSQFDNLM